jgi:hypothetical protein
MLLQLHRLSQPAIMLFVVNFCTQHGQHRQAIACLTTQQENNVYVFAFNFKQKLIRTIYTCKMMSQY